MKNGKYLSEFIPNVLIYMKNGKTLILDFLGKVRDDLLDFVGHEREFMIPEPSANG